ncbi:MAG: DUF6580 family putative transport protein [Candidatus Kapaibacterium sp.]
MNSLSISSFINLSAFSKKLGICISIFALFGGAIVKSKKIALAVPIVAVFLSDLVLGLHELMIAVYLCLGIFMYMGMKLNRKNSKSVATNAIASAVIFFNVTNFSVWAFGGIYEQNLSGLMLSYSLALPFFNWNMLSTLLFSGVLFGAYSLFEKYSFTEAKVQEIRINDKYCCPKY